LAPGTTEGTSEGSSAGTIEGQSAARLSPDERCSAAIEALHALAVELSIPRWAAAVVVDQSLELALHAPDLESRVESSVTQPEGPLLIPLGSATEVFTAVLTATLVDDGTLRWDDRVVTLLPTFKLAEPNAGPQCTLRDLLSHRTGLMRTDLAWLGNPPSASIVEAFGRAQPTVAFRSRVQPESTGYVPLGLALTNAAQTTTRPVTEPLATMEGWEALLRARLLAPLGMEHTGLDRPAEGGDAVAQRSFGAMVRSADGSWRAIPGRSLAHAGSAVGLRSSLPDLGRWLQLLVGRGRIGEQRLVSTERMEELWRPELPFRPDASPNIAGGAGLGFQSGVWRGQRVIRHRGGLEGLRVCLFLMPDEAVGVLLVASGAPEALARRAEERLLPILVGANAAGGVAGSPREGAETMVPLLGRYRSLVLGADLELREMGGRLELVVSDGGAYDLLPPDHSGRRALADVPDVFVTALPGEVADGSGPVRSLILEQSGMRFECTRVFAPLPAGAPDPALRELTGLYLDPAGSRNLAVVVAPSGRLALELPPHPSTDADAPGHVTEARRAAGRRPLLEFEPGMAPNDWRVAGVPSAGVTFNRDASGRVTGMSMRGMQGLEELPRIGDLSIEAAGILPDPMGLLRRHRAAGGAAENGQPAAPAARASDGAHAPPWAQAGSVRFLHQGLAGRFERRSSPQGLSARIDLGEYGSAVIELGDGGSTIDAFFDGPRPLEPIEADRWQLALDARSPAMWLPDSAFRFAGVDGPSSAPAGRFLLRTPAGAEALLTIDLATLRVRRLETEFSLGGAGDGPLVVSYETWADGTESPLSTRMRWDSREIGRVEWRSAEGP